MTDACEYLQADLNAHLTGDIPVKSTSELLLFPEAVDARTDDSLRGFSDAEIDVANDLLTEQIENFQWINKTLNDEQREAVLSIALGKQRIPFLVSGPPGTGKTSVLCEAVLQVSRCESVFAPFPVADCFACLDTATVSYDSHSPLWRQ